MSTHWSVDVPGKLPSGYMLCSQHVESTYGWASPHTLDWCQESVEIIRGAITHGLRYTTRDVRLHAYTDVDCAGSVVDQKSTSGCCFSLGFASISWMRRKQKSVALSTAEAKYIAVSMASCEVVLLRKLFSELFGFALDTTVILCDNQSGIHLLENLVFHDHSKHIDIKYHYIWDAARSNKAPTYRYRWAGYQHFDKAPGKSQILDFPRTTWVVERPSYEGRIWCIHRALGDPRGCGVLLGATYDHRATHPPLVVCYVQCQRFNLPLWYPVATLG